MEKRCAKWSRSQFVYRSLADTHGLALFGQSNFSENMPQRFRDYGIPTKKLPTRGWEGRGRGERERERENRAFLVVECASLARGEFPAPFRSFQSVTFISGDFPYLSLSRLKLRSPPCDGSIVDVRIHATALRATGLAGWFALREFL